MAIRSVVVLGTALFAAACVSSPSLSECSTDEECGSGNVCVAGSCVVDAPPAGDFAAPSGATTHRPMSIVPTLTDSEGRSVTARWSVSAPASACPPTVEPQVGDALSVIFWCPGTYEVSLTPVDSAGTEGAVVARSIKVTEAEGAPILEIDPSVVATHSCDLALPECIVLGLDSSAALHLEVSAVDPGGGALALSWTALPPDFAVYDPTLLVTFLTVPTVASPAVAIVNTSGGRISGTYRFRVRATNAAGLVEEAFQEILVGNGGPAAALGPWILSHWLEGGLYVAEGDLSTGTVDPDGDALFAEGTLSDSANLPPGCAETVTPGDASGSLHVRIACSTEAALIGTTPRTLDATITDANGASLMLSSTLTIESTLSDPP